MKMRKNLKPSPELTSIVTRKTSQLQEMIDDTEAHVYGGNVIDEGESRTFYNIKSICAAFLANIDEHKAVDVKFVGQVYTLPPWSVSILPDCRNVAFKFQHSKGVNVLIGKNNSAYHLVRAQISIKLLELNSPSSLMHAPQKLMLHEEVPHIANDWMTLKEPIGLWGQE